VQKSRAKVWRETTTFDDSAQSGRSDMDFALDFCLTSRVGTQRNHRGALTIAFDALLTRQHTISSFFRVNEIVGF
jgi:hypothetical protein